MNARLKLSPARFKSLVDVLDSTSIPLGDLCSKLWSPSHLLDSSPIAVGTTLAALLHDDLLPTPPNRLIAIYVLYDMLVTPHPTPLTKNSESGTERLVSSPLTAILFHLVDSGDSRPHEQLLLTHLLSNTHSGGTDVIPPQIASAGAVTLCNALEGALQSGASVPKLNMTALRRDWFQKHPKAPERERLPNISAIIHDADETSKDLSLADELGEVVSLEEFAPEFVRLPPPFIDVGIECKELRWIDPEIGHEIVWDRDMGMKGQRGSEVREVISRALKSPVAEKELKLVVSELEKDPKLVHLCGMTPSKLPDLVQNNSQLATEILFKLVGSNQMPAYLSALLAMEVNMHSMEVVSRLTKSCVLRSEVLHTYISHCIRSCGKISDKYDQNRMVRFVCVFLKNIITNNVIDAKELLIEVQAFCIDYSRIREVADLFRSLKTQGSANKN